MRSDFLYFHVEHEVDLRRRAPSSKGLEPVPGAVQHHRRSRPILRRQVQRQVRRPLDVQPRRTTIRSSGSPGRPCGRAGTAGSAWSIPRRWGGTGNGRPSISRSLRPTRGASAAQEGARGALHQLHPGRACLPLKECATRLRSQNRRLSLSASLTLTALIAIAAAGCLEGPTEPEEEPLLVIDTTSLRFGQSLDQKTFSISNGGGGRVDWGVSVGDDTPWCTVHPDAGTDEGTVTVSVDRNGLPTGEHNARITVESNSGTEEILVTVLVVATTGDIVIDVPLPEEETVR